MIAQDVALLERNPEWRLLLSAYQAQQAASADGWVDRILEIEGLDAAELSRIHGRMIADGLLEFELAERGLGVRYQLSPQGVRALHSTSAISSESGLSDDPEDADESDAG